MTSRKGSRAGGAVASLNRSARRFATQHVVASSRANEGSKKGSIMSKRTAEEIAARCFTVHPPPCEKCGDAWNVHEVDLEGPASCDACDCADYVGPTVREHYQSQVAQAIRAQMDRADEAEAGLAESRAVTAGLAEGAWVWQGDGFDELESMSDGMAVTMTAGKLRELLAEAQQKGIT